MSADGLQQTEDGQLGADEADVSEQLAEMRKQIAALTTEIAELEAENEELRERVESTYDKSDWALKQIADVRSDISEIREQGISDIDTELEIALARSGDEILDDYGIAEQRALVMAHVIDDCRGEGGVRISNDTLQRRLEHELEESLAWAQLDRAADALASMAGDAIEHVSDRDGNRLVIHDDSVLPN